MSEENPTTEEQIDLVEVAEEIQKEVHTKRGGRRKKAEPEKAEKTEFRICCTTKVVGTMWDPQRNLRIPPAGHGDVKVGGPVKEGSWLQCQIAAGLVQIVD